MRYTRRIYAIICAEKKIVNQKREMLKKGLTKKLRRGKIFST